MKILYLCADRGISLAKHNGATAHFRSLVTSFTKLGHELLVVTPSDVPPGLLPAPSERIPTPKILEHLLAEVEAPVPRAQKERQRRRKRVVHALGHAWNNVCTEQALEAIIPRFRPDLVFELYSPYGVAGPVTAARLGVRHVLNVHAPLAWEGATFRAQALQEAAEVLEEAVLRAARCIVVNSEEMREQLVATGVDAGKITVVINGVDFDMFSPDGPVSPAGPPGSIVVGFCGSLKGWHGVDVLANAFREVADDPRLHLLIVGDGPLRTEIEKLSSELPGRVTFTGGLPFEEVPPHVRAMDIAVAPYPPLEKFYFSPLKVLEYMAAARPTIASAIGQNATLLREGETGLLVPAGEAAPLAAAIRRLANDEPLRRRMGEAARRETLDRHAWTARAADILAASERGAA